MLHTFQRYDPFGIISALRVSFKMTPYNHTPRLTIEKFMNQETWVHVTLQGAYEQVMSTPTGQTPVSQSKQQKRLREETSSTEDVLKGFIF